MIGHLLRRAVYEPAMHLALLALRPLIIRRYLRTHHPAKLHIGAGNHMLRNWLNADLAPANWQYIVGGGIVLDAREPFPFDDGCLDYIFTEHMIEHLDYRQGEAMLRECYRVLRDTGRIRIATPDLRRIVSLCQPPLAPEQVDYVRWAVERYWLDIGAYMGGFAINNFFYRWGHRFIYDEDTLKLALERAGFVEVALYRSGLSDDPNLQAVEGHGEVIGERQHLFETLILEARRPPDLPPRRGTGSPGS